jgi:hypothetical protein
LEFLIQGVMFLVIGAVTLAEYLTSLEAAPGPLRFLAELLSALVTLYVIVAGTRQGFRHVNPKYWVAFGGLAVLVVCGAISNGVAAGPVVAGMRFYLRAIPFFFLPAVYDFKDWQLRQHLRLLCVVCLLQVPVAVYERHTIMATGHTSNADAVFGTLMQSGVLTLFLVCALCLLGAAMMRGRLTKWTFGILFLLFLIPMSINETKITVIVLPLGLLITFILSAAPHRRLRAAAAAAGMLALGSAVFIPVFDYYQSKSVVPYKIADFFTNKTELANYLDTGARVGSEKEAGRVDAVVIPLQELSRDPVTFVLGLGLGNASHSSLGPAFTGAHFGVYGRYTLETSEAAFMLELGTLGVALILWIHWLVFTDALFVARRDDGLVGALALGFVGALVVVTISLFYITIHTAESLSYLFWFYAGVIAARRERIRIADIKPDLHLAHQVTTDP